MISLITRTEAVALRISPYSESSHVVTWLTPDHGIVTTVMKGACRPKSPFLGQYDLFYTCELLFYERERNGVHIAWECSPTHSRRGLREDWRASALASYWCDLVSRTSAVGHNEAGVFSLLNTSLDFMVSNGARPQLLFWFELHLAHELGVSPNFDRCAACHRDLSASTSDKSPLFFAAPRGGLLCSDCSRAASDPSVHISPDAVATLQTWQASPSPRTAHHSVCQKPQLLAFNQLLGIFIQYHFDLLPASRAIAFEIAMIPTVLLPGGKT